MHIQKLSGHRAVIFAIGQLSCYNLFTKIKRDHRVQRLNGHTTWTFFSLGEFIYYAGIHHV